MHTLDVVAAVWLESGKTTFRFCPVGFLEEFISLTLAIGSICDDNPPLPFSNQHRHTENMKITYCSCGNWTESTYRASALTYSQHGHRAEGYCHELEGAFWSLG